jgi:hypothetical protein
VMAPGTGVMCRKGDPVRLPQRRSPRSGPKRKAADGPDPWETTRE